MTAAAGYVLVECYVTGDVVGQFREAIQAAGLIPPGEVTADGNLHRFSSNGKRGDDAGWYVLYLDGIPAGSFGCWRTDVYQPWRVRSERPWTATEQDAYRARMAATRRAREADKVRRQGEAATQAARIWDAADPAPDGHPYLVRKGITGHGIRQHSDGRLVVPVQIGKAIASLQFIDEAGGKMFLSGGQVKGGFFGIGTTSGAAVLCIVEGFATGATVHEVTGYPTAVAFNAGNLQAVASAMRERCRDLPLIVCGDDDWEVEGNPGRSKATEAARSVGARLALPERLNGVTDFNDMAQHLGIDAVRAAVDDAVPVEDCQPAKSVEVANEWPELVSLDTPELPQLDVSGLPGWAGDYVAALAASTETPPELAAALVLASCSAAAARRVCVQVRPGYCEPCNLWVVVALPPGNRKSTVQSSATAPLISWEREAAAAMEPEILRVSSDRKTLEARAKELRNKAAKAKDRALAEEDAREAAEIEATLPEVPRTTQLWTSDSTPERMGTLLADNDERMGWLSSEGGVFDVLQGRYSKGIPNLDLMLKAWSGDAERVDRGSRPPVYLKYPLLTVGLSPQPDVLRGLAAAPVFRGRGLIARFLYLLPPSPLGYRKLEAPPVPHRVSAAYAAGVRAMLDWPSSVSDEGEVCPRLLKLTPEAYSEWMDFGRCMEAAMLPGGDFECATDWAGKAPGAAIRLAGVLHGIEHAHGEPWGIRISSDTMVFALEIMAVITRHSLAALDLMGADEGIAAARRVWQWVVAGRRGHFTVREAYQALKGTFPRVGGLRTALGVLEERGYVVVAEPITEGPGRPPSPMVTVRPDITEAWQ